MAGLGAIFTILEVQMMIHIDNKKEKKRERKKTTKCKCFPKRMTSIQHTFLVIR